MKTFIAAEPRLTVYAFEYATRCGAPPAERCGRKLLADVGPLASAPSSIFGISNADFPYPVVTLSDGRAKGEPRTLHGAALVAEPRDRKAVQSSYFTSLGEYAAPSAR
jgi:hypothetical protein